MEDQIRKIVREEIARALGALGAVAHEVYMDAPEDSSTEASADVLRRGVRRVARDVLANVHPALEPEHTASTPSTQPVHTITAVPERPRATCTCHRHTHVMGHDDRCGSPFCYCLSPVRARDEHTDVHASTEEPRTCPTCKHGVHEPGKCAMHVYLRGEPVHCPCMEWVRPEAVVRTGARRVCTLCEHAPHGAGNCGAVTGQGTPFAAPCECGGRA